MEKGKRAQPGSNRWPLDLQSNALPLSYGPFLDMSNVNGWLKKANVKMKIRCEVIKKNVLTQY